MHYLSRIARLVVAALAVIAGLTFVASPAQAQWLKAESERFVIYSNGDERTLRAYVQKLETFDRVLRLYMGRPMEEAPPRRLPVYLVGNHRELTRILPNALENQAGVYIPSDQDIFAVARRSRGEDSTLLHEYAHHFMFQNAPYPYPAWFVEGFAEYYAATNITPGRVEVGKFETNNVAWLQGDDWMPMEDLLAGRAVGAGGDRFSPTYYPLTWLLTHWFMGDAQRRAALTRYLRDVGSGANPVEAFERHTGLSPTALRGVLRTYLNGRIPYSAVSHEFPQVAVSVERLPASANDLLLINQRVKIARNRESDDTLIEQVRALASRHPGDPFARLVLGRAEILLGDPQKGEAELAALLEAHPDHVEALQLMAMARLNGAADHPEGFDVALRQMRGFLRRAYEADDADYRTFLLIAESRIGEPGYPNENDLRAWESAYALAPQLGQTRFGLAQALMAHDRNAEAIEILEPMANDPHHPEAAGAVRLLIERARTAANGTEPDAPEGG